MGDRAPGHGEQILQFIYLAARGKVPELYLNRGGWIFSREVPKDINFEEEEEGIVVFENDSMGSDVPVKEDGRIPFSDSDVG